MKKWTIKTINPETGVVVKPEPTRSLLLVARAVAAGTAAGMLVHISPILTKAEKLFVANVLYQSSGPSEGGE